MVFPHILTDELHAGSVGTTATTGGISTAASVAATTTHASMPAGALAGLRGCIAAHCARRRGAGDTLTIAAVCGALILGGLFGGAINAATLPTAQEVVPQAPEDPAFLQMDGPEPRFTIAPAGVACATFPGSNAIASGARSTAIATAGRAYAAVPGSTAIAYAPAQAGGVVGSAVVLLSTRPDGSRVGMILRPGAGAAQAARWYGSTSGMLTPGAPLTDSELAAIVEAAQGNLP